MRIFGGMEGDYKSLGKPSARQPLACASTATKAPIYPKSPLSSAVKSVQLTYNPKPPLCVNTEKYSIHKCLV